MTLENDSLVLNFVTGRRVIPLKAVGLEWPPPERVMLGDGGIREATSEDDEHYTMVRVRMSQLDEQAADHPNVMRGAEYEYAATD